MITIVIPGLIFFIVSLLCLNFAFLEDKENCIELPLKECLGTEMPFPQGESANLKVVTLAWCILSIMRTSAF